MQTLKPAEKQRYQRHLLLEQIGEEGQTRLRNASVLVVGAGGLGCPVMQFLTATGIGRIGIVDDDLVDISNLQRQFLYGFGDVGKHKAVVSAQKMEQLNGFVGVERLNCRLNADNALQLVATYDVIADCTDNHEARFLINDACVFSSKPMVHAGVFRHQGQLAVFNHQGGPTYRCFHDEDKASSPNPPADGIYSVLPGIIGALQSNEIIKLITGIGRLLNGVLLTFDTWQNEFYELRIPGIEKNHDTDYLKTITKLKLS